MPLPPKDDPSVVSLQVSMALRQFRDGLDRHLAGHTVARALDWSASKVSRYEQARTPVSVSGLTQILAYYTRAHGMTAAQAKNIRAMFDAALDTAWLQHPYLGSGVTAPEIFE